MICVMDMTYIRKNNASTDCSYSHVGSSHVTVVKSQQQVVQGSRAAESSCPAELKPTGSCEAVRDVAA